MRRFLDQFRAQGNAFPSILKAFAKVNARIENSLFPDLLFSRPCSRCVAGVQPGAWRSPRREPLRHQREAILRIILTLSLVSVLGLGAAMSYLLWRGEEPGGIDDAYAFVFGPADQGPVDFDALVRTGAPHDALACPEAACGTALIDIVTPLYPIAGSQLRRIVRTVASRQQGTQLVYSARWEEEDRYVVRSKLLRFPDTVNVRIYGAGDEGSMLALYSRSQIGYSDMGVNERRLRIWLAEIDELVREQAQP
jgi:uncharacterized protein (DUF1499 family)